MPHIRPVSDLRNHFADISTVHETVHETEEPVFLTKNGYGDMELCQDGFGKNDE